MIYFDNENEDINSDEDCLSSCSEGEAKTLSVAFDDSEDERASGIGDGFGVPYAEPLNDINRVIIEGKSYRIKYKANKTSTPRQKTQTPNKHDVCEKFKMNHLRPMYSRLV
ncbi:hypothetical protein QL285_057061 [Trifolium repens]|nr:hypothetical protein QL285_057061 [Trifolium repens]